MSTLKDRLKRGEVVFGGTIYEYLRPAVVKAYRNAGFDFIYLENEHVAFDHARLADLVLCGKDNGLSSVAKIPELARAEAARLLDMGVIGIQLPRTESRSEMVQLRGYIKFPPDGNRASSSGLGNTSYTKPKDKSQWYRDANEETILIAHIETLKGVQNVQEIVSLPGLDICFVGTSDLSVDLGRPGDYSSSEFRATVQRIFDEAKRSGLVCGLPASDYDTAKYWIERGVQFFECHSELDLIRAGAAKAVQELARAKG